MSQQSEANNAKDGTAKSQIVMLNIAFFATYFLPTRPCRGVYSLRAHVRLNTQKTFQEVGILFIKMLMLLPYKLAVEWPPAGSVTDPCQGKSSALSWHFRVNLLIGRVSAASSRRRPKDASFTLKRERK